MKRFGMVLVISVLVAVSGCIFDTDDDNDNRDSLTGQVDGLGIGSIAAEYYPMVPGSVWVYDQKYASEVLNTSQVVTEVCGSKYTIDGTTYFRVESTLNTESSPEHTHYWYDGDDVYYIIPADIAEMLYGSERNHLQYRFDVDEGEIWSVYEYKWVPDQEDIDQGSNDASEYIDTITKKSYIGKQSIWTKAGKFDNCMTFKTISRTQYREMIYNRWGGPQEKVLEDGHYEETTYTWFAPGVGLVKTEMNQTGVMGNDPISSYRVKELTSYDIPSFPERHSITGKVVDWDGGGVSGVTVAVTGEDVSRTVMTDVDGYFIFDDLQPGYYEVMPQLTGKDIVPGIATLHIIESDTYAGTFLCQDVTASAIKPTYAAEVYLQFNEGATWTYSRTSYNDQGEPYGEQRLLEYVCNGEVLHEETGEQFIELDTDFYDYEYYAVDGEDVYHHNPDAWILVTVAKPALIQSHGGVEDAFDNETGEMLVYTFDKPAGTAWSIVESSSTRDSSYVTMCFSGRYTGLETVETGAGTFDGCARFETVIQSGFHADSFKGGDTYYVSGSQTFILTRWFAPNVGLVKETQVEFRDGDDLQEDGTIVDKRGRFLYDEELILQAYSIP